MAFERYWLFDWLDEAGIRKAADAKAALKRGSTALTGLRERAEREERKLWSPASGPNSILAGTGLDLTGNLGCYNVDCRKKDVDELFRRAWHYFDRIVATDQVTHDVAVHWDAARPEDFVDALVDQLAVLLHIRHIGAQDLVEFRKKRPMDVAYWKEKLGATEVQDAARAPELAGVLVKEAEISRDQERGDIWWLNHPALGHVQFCQVTDSERMDVDDEATRARIVSELMERFAGYLMSDIATARHAGAALGSANTVHEAMVTSQAEASVGSVAFQIEFPFLERVPIRTLIRIRQEEADQFARVQSSLRTAIKERLLARPTSNQETIAKEIQEDVIEPELNKLRTRLAAANNALQRKAAVAGGMAAFSATFAYLGGPELASLLGLAVPMEMARRATEGFFDDRKEVESSDMFLFLKAAQHGHGRR